MSLRTSMSLVGEEYESEGGEEESVDDDDDDDDDEDEEEEMIKRQKNSTPYLESPGNVALQINDQAHLQPVSVPGEQSYEFKKDGKVLAHLYGASTFGEFMAYTRMVVTDDGTRSRYYSVQTGTIVDTPRATHAKKGSEQLPRREAVVYRILIGATPTGKQKTATDQQRCFLLTLSAKKTRYESTSGYLYNYDNEVYLCKLYYDANPDLTPASDLKPLTIRDFEWFYAGSTTTHTKICQLFYLPGFHMERKLLLALATSEFHNHSPISVSAAQGRVRRSVANP